MAAMRRTALLCAALLGLAPLLTACGGEEAPEVRVSDVIPAREDDQFEGRRASTVMVPSGRLRVWLGQPVDSADSDETRQLEGLEAPDGAVLVPITWRFERAFPDAHAFLGETPAPGIDLVTEAGSYRLPAPETGSDVSESFYVVVDGDGEDLRLEVEFDGVTQTVDLRTRERRTGRASALYGLDHERLRSEDCGSADWLEEGQGGAAYACEVSGPLLLPYANGKWAETGHRWLAVGVRTTLRHWAVADLEGGGAFYYGTRTRLDGELGGKAPAAAFDGSQSACPVEGSSTCIADRLLVFDVTDDVPERLEIEQHFQLALLNRWGGFAPKQRMSGDIDGTITLDLPEDRGA